MLKKATLFLLTLTILLCSCGVGYAAENPEQIVSVKTSNDVRMLYVSFTDCNLDVHANGLAEMYGSVNAKPGVDRVKISMYLQRYNNGWSTVKHWVNEYKGTYGSMNKSYYVTKGYTYRVLVYFYAFEGSESESTYSIDEEWY